MSHFVIDTNVLMVADGKSEQAGPDCIINAIEVLEKIKGGKKICLDDKLRIHDEYMQNLGYAGQPGAGAAFAKWIHENQAVESICKIVSITENSEREFEEFPDDPRLNNFDRSDRKFVAVAKASGSNPEIINAVDSDWWDFRVQLEHNGVRIRFICPDQFE